MTSTFIGLEIAKRTLFATQAAQQTTANNISNANTEGYSRQTVNFVTMQPLDALGFSASTAAGQIGQGAEAGSITRVREQFLDDQYRQQNTAYGEWSTRDDTMQKLQAIYNEPSNTGLRTTVENFWNAWQQLANNPEDQTARVTLNQSALAMTDAMNYTANQLNQLNSDLNSNLGTIASQADTMLQQITGLNSQIYKIEGLGQNANDLRDQRDLLVDKLSKIMNVSVTETPQGYNISMGSTALVTGFQKNATVNAGFLTSNYGNDLKSGQAYGILYSQKQYVGTNLDQLNALVKTMATGNVTVTLPKGTMLPSGTTVTGADGKTYSGTLAADTPVVVAGLNGLHQLGYDLNGQSGEPFFTMTSGSEAATVTVNPDISNDVSKIAASTQVYTDSNGNTATVKGNSDLALAIAGMNNDQFAFNATTNATLSDYYQSMIGQMGVQASESTRQMNNQQALVQQVDSQRQSVSGVSLDEEMANMLKYQQAYNAAARLMTTFDDMLDKVISGMGLVGR